MQPVWSVSHLECAIARDKATAGDKNTLNAVTDAMWDWLEGHPDEGQLLYSHLPGTTPHARALWEEFEARHVRQALDYLEEVRGPRPGYSAAANKAAIGGRAQPAIAAVRSAAKVRRCRLPVFHRAVDFSGR